MLFESTVYFTENAEIVENISAYFLGMLIERRTNPPNSTKNQDNQPR